MSAARTLKAPGGLGYSDREETNGAATENGNTLSGEVVGECGEDGVPEGFLERGNLRREFFSIVLPYHRFGHGDVFCKYAVAIDAEYLRPRAHVGLTCPTLEAETAGDVALGGDIIANPYLRYIRPDIYNRTRKFMSHC